MLLMHLSDEDQRTFMSVAELLCLADQPLLWGGKRRDQITAGTDIANVSIERSEVESAALEQLQSLLASGTGRFKITLKRHNVERELVQRMQSMPLDQTEQPAVRSNVATEVLRALLKDKTAALPSVPKLMLFELFLLALKDGGISSIEWQLLTEFRHHYGLEDFIFDDLRERAECTHREAQKTLAIILE
jgi:hypothetical protein